MSIDIDSTSSESGVTFGYPSHLNNIDPLTVTAWMYPTGWGGGSFGRVMSKEYGTAGWLLCLCNTGGYTEGLRFVRYRATTATDVSGYPSDIVLNQWQHVAVTYKSTQTLLYLNGLNMPLGLNTVGSGALVTDASATLYAGNRTAYGRGFKGRLEGCKIWNRVLTPNEIYQVFLARGHDAIPDVLFDCPLTENAPGVTTGTDTVFMDKTINAAHGSSIYANSTWYEGVLVPRRPV